MTMGRIITMLNCIHHDQHQREPWLLEYETRSPRHNEKKTEIDKATLVEYEHYFRRYLGKYLLANK